MRRLLTALVLAAFVAACSSPQPSVLVFSKTNGYRHQSIEAGQRMLGRIADREGYAMAFTEDSTAFREDYLRGFDAVVFLMTTQDVLGTDQEIALQRFIQAGGGYVGVHAASDTEYGWPWYGRMVGAYFTGHPPGTPEGVISVVDSTFPATAHLPEQWTKADEWYDLRYTNQFVNPLLTVDEFTYKTAEQNPQGSADLHAWYHEFEGGRSFYTALGHNEASYTDTLFVQHIEGGLHWAIGEPGSLDYSAPTVRPLAAEFDVQVLADTLNEPMELDVLPDGRVLFVERRGEVHIIDPADGSDIIAGVVPVDSEREDGLLGVAIDPSFPENGWVFMYRTPPVEEPLNRLSRFTLKGSELDLSSEVHILDVTVQRDECCHSGGSVEFGPDGTLYLSTGDNTNPFASSGFAPTDERPGRVPWDAQRTAANTHDLRGKVLRIQPLPEGGYAVPDGNLFPSDGSRGRPEIYGMGMRNPFRINIDQRTGWLYWGDIGPDAVDDDPDRGPKGHDEINQARGPGFFGWPYFIADNKPYAEYDFAREQAGDFAVGAAPLNDSPNNTGRSLLPPAQGAWMWYPYGASAEFPALAEGGRSAMAGPIYYADDHAAGPGRFPEYFSGRLFMHEWMRNKIYTVDIDDHGWYAYMEEFSPGITFSRPMDMRFSPDGVLYVIDYGNVWNAENPDARLIRIAFGG